MEGFLFRSAGWRWFLLYSAYRTKRSFQRKERKEGHSPDLKRIIARSPSLSLLVSLPVCRPNPLSTTCQAGMDDDLIGCDSVPAQRVPRDHGFAWSDPKQMFQ